MMASLAVGGVLLLAMIAASARGAVRIARLGRALLLRVQAGRTDHLARDRRGAFVVLGGITKSSLAAGWVPGLRDVLGRSRTGNHGPF